MSDIILFIITVGLTLWILASTLTYYNLFVKGGFHKESPTAERIGVFLIIMFTWYAIRAFIVIMEIFKKGDEVEKMFVKSVNKEKK